MSWLELPSSMQGPAGELISKSTEVMTLKIMPWIIFYVQPCAKDATSASRTVPAWRRSQLSLFVEEVSQAQRGEGACPRTHSPQVAEPGCGLRSHVAVSWLAVWRVPCWALGTQGGQVQWEALRCPERLPGSSCTVYPVPWEQRQGSGCVHVGGAGTWEEPAARPQMVALPTSATSLPGSRRGSVEKVGEAGVPCARARLRGGCLCEFCVRCLCGAGG